MSWAKKFKRNQIKKFLTDELKDEKIFTSKTKTEQKETIKVLYKQFKNGEFSGES